MTEPDLTEKHAPVAPQAEGASRYPHNPVHGAYVIVQARDLDTLARYVCRMLDVGYNPRGDIVQFMDHSFAQAMTNWSKLQRIQEPPPHAD